MRWQILSHYPKDLERQLLINRDISSRDADDFLNPDFSKLHDPFLLSDLEKARIRIIAAIKNKEPIGIFGDYDADGILGAVILSEAITHLGGKVLVYIPTRKEGYGLSRQGIDVLKSQGAKVIVTVDNGIKSFNEVGYAQSQGIDTIVTDHHEPGETLPKASAIINPKREDDKYPFKFLSGSGVAYKLVQSLGLSETHFKWLLDMVGVATITDIVPLIGENRVLAKWGLVVLQKTKRLGLKALYEKAGLDRQKIGSYHVGFIIGPRINAAGRLAHPQLAFDLLTTNNKNLANKVASELDEINLRRQKVLEEMVAQAREIIEKKFLEDKFLILKEESWEAGVLGLAAGKLMEIYNRPICLFTPRGNVLIGSCRSTEVFNITDALEKVSDLLLHFGGHDRAAGLSIKEENFKKMGKRLKEMAEKIIKDEDLIPELKIDALIHPKNLSKKFATFLKKMEPFGYGNPRPVLMLEKIKVLGTRRVGKENQHLKIQIDGKESELALKYALRLTSGFKLEGIGFNLGGDFSKIFPGEPIDIAFHLEENLWQDRLTHQLKILAWRKSE